MTEPTPHALVKDGAVINRLWFPDTPTLAANKGAWLPVVTVGAPDPQKIIVTTIEAARVVDTWTDLPLADLVAAKKSAAAAKSDAVFAAGFKVTGGTLDGATLALRNAEDRTNWLTLQNLCSAQIAAGRGAVLGAPFRSLANDNYLLTFSEAFGVLVALAVWGSAVYARLWAIKDAADAAASKAVLDAIDIDAGWPG